jgi:hypothetical protein
MDEKFDELAQELARGVGRREALRRIGGVLAGVLLASLGVPSHADPIRSECRQKCQAGGCEGKDVKWCTTNCVLCFRDNGGGARFVVNEGCNQTTCYPV